MALAIPSHDARWWPRAIPRPLYVSIHGYDWAPIIKRSGRSFSCRLRLFGAGLDLRLDEALRRWSFAIGARWLLSLAFGHSQETPTEFHGDTGSGPVTYAEHRYVELTAFLLSICLGREGDAPWRARLFFNGRRLFYKRANV